MTLELGLTSESLAKQLENQAGKPFPGPLVAECATLDAMKEQIDNLQVSGIILESEAQRARSRLLRKFTEMLERYVR